MSNGQIKWSKNIKKHPPLLPGFFAGFQQRSVHQPFFPSNPLHLNKRPMHSTTCYVTACEVASGQERTQHAPFRSPNFTPSFSERGSSNLKHIKQANHPQITGQLVMLIYSEPGLILGIIAPLTFTSPPRS